MKTSNVSAEERVEHTPTPWKVVGFSSLNNKDRGFLVKSGDEKIVLRMLAVSKNSGPVKANAEYICRAVNSHEALVSALRAALPFLEAHRSNAITMLENADVPSARDLIGDRLSKLNETLTAARDALKQAGA